MGAAVAVGPLTQEQQYQATLAREFNMLTPTMAMKFSVVHPARSQYMFGDADDVVMFAEARAIQVLGHTLVWHDSLPAWVTRGAFSRQQWRDILRDHVSTVVRRYRGRVAAWGVVNEAISDDGSLRDTIWLRNIGPEYIDLAFRWAHEADPDAQLFYNDYGGEGMGLKSDAIYAMLKGMLERGVPVNGVGLEMHVASDGYPRPQDVAANIKRLGALGLQANISEMDVRIEGEVTPGKLAAQAAVYGEMLRAGLSNANFKSFVTWGVTDRYHYVPDSFRGWGSGLIFDSSYHPKPAYEAIRGVLGGY